MSIELLNPCERVNVTAFFGETRRQVEKAVETFAKSHKVIRTSYEYNSNRPSYRQHAIWIIYTERRSNA